MRPERTQMQNHDPEHQRRFRALDGQPDASVARRRKESQSANFSCLLAHYR